MYTTYSYNRSGHASTPVQLDKSGSSSSCWYELMIIKNQSRLCTRYQVIYFLYRQVCWGPTPFYTHTHLNTHICTNIHIKHTHTHTPITCQLQYTVRVLQNATGQLHVFFIVTLACIILAMTSHLSCVIVIPFYATFPSAGSPLPQPLCTGIFPSL